MRIMAWIVEESGSKSCHGWIESADGKRFHMRSGWPFEDWRMPKAASAGHAPHQHRLILLREMFLAVEIDEVP